MEETIKTFVENNEVLKKYKEYPKEELKLVRTHIALDLRSTYTNKDNVEIIKLPQICSNEPYNCIEHFLALRYGIDENLVSVNDNLENIKKYKVCKFCNCKQCFRKTYNILIEEIDKYNNSNNKIKIKYIDVINYLLNEFRNYKENQEYIMNNYNSRLKFLKEKCLELKNNFKKMHATMNSIIETQYSKNQASNDFLL